MKKLIAIFAIILILTQFVSALDDNLKSRDDTVVVYFFWGEGCPHCINQKPFMEKLKQRYPEQVVKDFMPEGQNIHFHNSTQDAIAEGIDSAVLISWNEYGEGLGLVIPVDEGGKIEKYRLPILYSFDKQTISSNEPKIDSSIYLDI